MPDAIMKTVWDAKDSISAECHYSPRELAAMLKLSKLSHGEETVDLHGDSNKSMHLTGAPRPPETGRPRCPVR